MWAAISPPRRSIVELLREGVLDPELAALVWLLVEARLPLIVAAAGSRVGKTTLLEALLDFLPPGVARIDLRGEAETFDWLPEAGELGWREEARRGGAAASGGRPGQVRPAAAAPTSTYLVAAELSSHMPLYTWGAQARVAIRAAAIGYGLGATIHADRLEEVHAALAGPAVRATEDELASLGVVLVLRVTGWGEDGPVRRVVAAHYERPVARDVHGHVQRPGPAVLAAWDERSRALEHYGWGIAPELAARVGRRAGDFELEQAARAAYLRGLAEAGLAAVEDVRSAIRSYRGVAAGGSGHRH
jgi:hypothetical protein